MIAITHLRRVGIATPEPRELADFYEQIWGLRRVDERAGKIYLRGSGGEHHLVVLAPGPRPSVRLVGFGLPDAAAVDAAAQELAGRTGVRIVGPAELDTPGGGYGLRVVDPDGRVLELSAEVAAVEPDDYRAVVRPVKLSHVVLNSPRVDAYAELLTDVLGFRLADEMPHMSFFRCSADHHSLAIARAPHASLNHIAFEVPTYDDVLKGIHHLGGHGIEPIWGPGRHGPGNNVFGYFTAPNHQVVEYTAEVEQITPGDDRPPRMWLPEDIRVSDPWASPESARPTPQAREWMLGDPEPEEQEPTQSPQPTTDRA
jgi:catechol 2,3-dioxygenase-like lactoylglutathione lyase family enzyme